MSPLYTIVTLLVVMALLGAVGATSISLQQQVFAQPSKSPDPCKAFKELTKYIEDAGLLAVGAGDDDKMSSLVDDFRHYGKLILELSPPDKGKC